VTASRGPGGPRRDYDNTRRREQAAETRGRIVDAGCALHREGPLRDWRGITVRAVAERAGVNERTIYRHFQNERGLRDAVMHHIEAEAGIDLERLDLDDLADLTRRLLAHVATFPRPDRPPLDPTLSEASRRQHDALVKAVAERTAGWSRPDQTNAAAVLDVLWSAAAYERLVGDWGFDSDRAIVSLVWAVEALSRTIPAGSMPSRESQPPSE